MRIAYGTDQVTPVTQAIAELLGEWGHEVVPLAEGDEWPEVGQRVGEAVAAGRADVGIVWCFTGTGVSIAANKVSGVRAALCLDAATAVWRPPLERCQRARARSPADRPDGCRRDREGVPGDRCGSSRA